MPAPRSYPVELRAVEAGRAARRALSLPSKVIARFERSFYVESSAGIACIGSDALGSGPLNAIVDGFAVVPPLAAEVRVSMRGAQTWRPPEAPRADAWRIGDDNPVLHGRGIFAVPHPGAAALKGWLATGAHGAAPTAAAALIGQGPGLTPAGDDLVGGALIALHAMRRRAVAARLGAWALRLARSRTSRISRAHLACAARGEGGMALHALLNALLAGRRKPVRELAAVDAVGHTSGWDAAAGAALVLELLRPPRTPRARSPAPANRPARRSAARPA